MGWEPPLSEQEDTCGFHANEMETSCMLEATEGLVDMAQAICEYPAHIDDQSELRPEGAPATFAWVTQDISRSWNRRRCGGCYSRKGKGMGGEICGEFGTAD